MTTYYKATRPDGTDFRTGTINYAAALQTGETITHHATELIPDEASTYYSVSVEPAETLIGGQWPCRLFKVEADTAVESRTYRHKMCVPSLRVVEELPAWQALGPNGEAVAEFLEGIPAAWDAAGEAARDAARVAARAAARDAARAASMDAAGAGGLVSGGR